jgi:hypothetical protein
MHFTRHAILVRNNRNAVQPSLLDFELILQPAKERGEHGPINFYRRFDPCFLC